MTEITVKITKMDQTQYRRARGAAIRAGMSTGQWLSEVIREKLSRKGEKKSG